MSIPAVQGYRFAATWPHQDRTETDPVRQQDQHRPSVETQQLAAGVRLVSALLCLGVVLRQSTGFGPELLAPAGLSLWAAARLWRIPLAGWPQGAWSVTDGILDVLWIGLLLRTAAGIESMLLVMLVQPLLMTALVLGTRPALLLGTGAIAAVLLEGALRMPSPGLLHLPEPTLALALAVGMITVCSTVLVQPMDALRQRRTLLLPRLLDSIDPRRGLEATTAQIARTLRQLSGVPIVALTLPTATGGSAWFSSDAEGDFAASAPTHRQIERLLADLPEQVLSSAPRRLHTRLLGLDDAAPTDGSVRNLLTELGRLLQVEHLTVIPLRRDGRDRGHALLGWNRPAAKHVRSQDLIEIAPELVRLLDSAELVDLLQDEAAGHERSRIGRDLHDSAIQPYLGLKFAVEGLVQRADADNPLRQDLEALAQMVNSEIASLREVISLLRTGSTQGDNALVPAVRRLVQRFPRLFGVDVQLDCPATLNTSRALAGMLFQLINEALNNVRKHTSARRIWIRIERQDHTLHLRIRDNAGSLQGRRLPDFVPATLAERVADLGGTLDIGHADALDTELHITVPDPADGYRNTRSSFS